jgi:hypothetical protein
MDRSRQARYQPYARILAAGPAEAAGLGPDTGGCRTQDLAKLLRSQLARVSKHLALYLVKNVPCLYLVKNIPWL